MHQRHFKVWTIGITKEFLDKLISQELDSDLDTDNEMDVSECKRNKKKGKKSGLYHSVSDDVYVPPNWPHLQQGS